MTKKNYDLSAKIERIRELRESLRVERPIVTNANYWKSEGLQIALDILDAGPPVELSDFEDEIVPVDAG